MDDKVVEWLLEESNPSVRYFALKDLIDLPASDPSVAKAEKGIMLSGAVPEILTRQNDDGSWADPDKFYMDKYKGSIWTLLILSELAPDPNDPRVRKACEFILEYSQDPESGGFAYNRSAKTGRGIPSAVIPCLTGNMVYALIKLGYIDDQRVKRAIDWIVTYQRADDGTEKPLKGEFYTRYGDSCWGRHTCHMGVAKSLKALAAIPLGNRTKDIDKKIGVLAEYFLLHHIYKRSHDLSKVARPGWLKLGFPLMYQTDVLELLGIFADLGIKDPRLDDALEIIMNKRLKDGKWVLENSFNGKMTINIEKKGEPSKWVTLCALKILKKYDLH